MTRPRAIVTGSSGFLGRSLCGVLHKRGYTTTALTRVGSIIPDVVQDQIVIDDITSEDQIADALRHAKPDFIFHLAGAPSAASLAALYETNAIFGATIAKVAADSKEAATLIVVGSAAEYGKPSTNGLDFCETMSCRPASSYGITKLAQTLHVLAEYGQNSVVARLFNPVGANMPRHLALGTFAQQIRWMDHSGGALRTGNLDAVRDFIDVQQAAESLTDLAQTPTARGKVVNICSGIGTRLRDIVQEMIAASGKAIDLLEGSAPGSANSSGIDRAVGNPQRLKDLGIKLPGLDRAALAKELVCDDVHRSTI